eukprot:COSAG06_NODE_56656_length_283_cov_1.603261_1_plen_37_part_10
MEHEFRGSSAPLPRFARQLAAADCRISDSGWRTQVAT